MIPSRIPSVLSTFGKAIAGAAALNFGRSGGRNCESTCRHHPDNFNAGEGGSEVCYAVGIEQRGDRAQLANKLDRHEQTPASRIVGAALVELEREALYDIPARPWFRFSTGGSLPSPRRAAADRLFIPRIVALLTFLAKRGTPVHLPVESAKKARWYRRMIGGLAVVRESLQTPRMTPDTIENHPIPDGPVSFTAGEDVPAGPNKRGRVIAAARAAAAAWARRTGRKTVVCPAVVVSFLSRSKATCGGRSKEQIDLWRAGAKCGACTACALAHIDVVYPAHGVSMIVKKP
jgi:hypothetical protein